VRAPAVVIAPIPAVIASAAKQSRTNATARLLDCFVAPLLAMTGFVAPLAMTGFVVLLLAMTGFVALLLAMTGFVALLLAMTGFVALLLAMTGFVAPLAMTGAHHPLPSPCEPSSSAVSPAPSAPPSHAHGVLHASPPSLRAQRSNPGRTPARDCWIASALRSSQ
jgi:hypothetical protein